MYSVADHGHALPLDRTEQCCGVCRSGLAQQGSAACSFTSRIRLYYSAASGVGASHWSKSRNARALSACLRSLPRNAPSIGGKKPKITFLGSEGAASPPPGGLAPRTP